MRQAILAVDTSVSAGASLQQEAFVRDLRPAASGCLLGALRAARMRPANALRQGK